MAGSRIPGPTGRSSPSLQIGDGLPTWFAAPGPAKAKPAPAPTLDDIRLVSGATDVRPGKKAAANTRYAAAIREKDAYVIVEAVFQGTAGVPSDPTWSGGEAVPGNPLRRRVSRSAWARHELTARLGSARKTMVVYVIGAEPTGFQGDGGKSYPDNKKRGKAEPPGLQASIPAKGEYHDKCQIQFTVRPQELVADAKAGRFLTDDIQWDVTREIMDRTWTLIPHDKDPRPFWGIWLDTGPNWKDDDNNEEDEDNDPWDGGGHLYGNDAPGRDEIPTWFLGLVRKFRAREWVRVNIGGGPGRSGKACSDYKYWHVTRSLSNTGKSWAQEKDYGGNEIKEGDPGWGTVPKEKQWGR